MTEPAVQQDRPPIPPPTPFVSFSSVTLDANGRPAPLQMRVLAPVSGDKLPVMLFSHGHGGSNYLASMRGYGPLVDFYAAHGYAVIVPTHLSSRTLGLAPADEGSLWWRSRAQDMHVILDRLAQIEATVPGLAGRLDHDRVVAVGHSLGGHTVAMLAGMRVVDPRTGETVDLREPRLTASVMMSPPGSGDDLADWAAEHYPELGSTDFSAMTLPSLVVTGTEDRNERFAARPDWRADAYRLSPGPKALLTLNGGGHMLGGVSGYDAKETDDESPDRLAAVQRISWAYLRSQLVSGDPSWSTIKEEFRTSNDPAGAIEEH